MDLVWSIAIYVFIWWITLFAVLPFGVRTQHEDGNVVPGTPESAPAKQRMLRIFLINTLLATVVFAIVYVVIAYKLITPDTIPVPVSGAAPKTRKSKVQRTLLLRAAALFSWSFAATTWARHARHLGTFSTTPLGSPRAPAFSLNSGCPPLLCAALTHPHGAYL